jgi:hypothetical protein
MAGPMTGSALSGASLAAQSRITLRSMRATCYDAEQPLQKPCRRACRLRGSVRDKKMLIVSIILEAAVAVIAALAARQGRPYLYGLAFTFAAYVLYDLARLLQWAVEGPLLSGLFLLATLTALVAVLALYREGRKG